MSGKPLTDPMLKLNRHGLPSYLPFMRHLINKEVDYVRFVNSILTISRFIDWWPEKGNYQPITDASTADFSEVEKLGKKMGRTYWSLNLPQLRVGWKDFHASDSQGPMGPALTSSVREIFFLSKELVNKLTILGGEKFSKMMKSVRKTSPEILKDVWTREFNLKGEDLRRISYIRDHEGKLRIICIFDYWSQTVLKPLHDELFKVLPLFKADCTFDQTNFRSLKGPYWCFDLSNATDRFPVVLQREVLRWIIGKEKALAWEWIMTQLDVRTPEGDIVKYNCGQPMGAYSSWAVFTLCHHLIIQHCARASMKIRGEYTNYAVLGDDVVICDERVASLYLKVMKSLGVEINQSKSIISKDTLEFAKRDFYQEAEYSQISLRAISDCSKRWPELWAFLQNLSTKSLETSVDPGIIKKLWVALGKSPSQATRLTNHMQALGAIQNYKDRINPYFHAYWYIDVFCKIPIEPWYWHQYHDLFGRGLLTFLNKTLTALVLSFQTKYGQMVYTFRKYNSIIPILNNLPPVVIASKEINDSQAWASLLNSAIHTGDWAFIKTLPHKYIPDARRLIHGGHQGSTRINLTVNKLKHYMRNNKNLMKYYLFTQDE